MPQESIWVTGARGFIGSHLVQYLSKQDTQIIGFGRKAASLEGCYTFVSGGISPEVLDNVIRVHGAPDRIYHLAGGSTVGQSIQDPVGDFDSNVVSTSHLFDALRRYSLDVPVVIASSAAVYGAGHKGAIACKAALHPYSPYGHHKCMAENIATYYAEIFSMRCTVLRLFSAYGPGIEKQLLFDLCTRLRGSEKQITLGGTGDELRDWCYISDVIAALISLDDPPSGQVKTYNLGTGTGTCIRDVANGVLQIWGDTRELVFTGNARLGDPFSLIAHRHSLPLGFSPEIEIETGLKRFVEWFKHQPVL